MQLGIAIQQENIPSVESLLRSCSEFGVSRSDIYKTFEQSWQGDTDTFNILLITLEKLEGSGKISWVQLNGLLMTAVKKGNVEAVDAAITHGADPHNSVQPGFSFFDTIF